MRDAADARGPSDAGPTASSAAADARATVAGAVPAAAVPPPPPEISGFAVERWIGSGAHGRVFLARETGGLKRPCALKVFEPWARERYEHELAMCARVEEMRRRSRAPEVVQSLATGVERGAMGETAWIALEWAEGGSLADRVAREGPLPLAEALAFAREAARGLALLHADGLFHRDVKPANLLVGADGRLRLADFGLARPLEGTLSAAGSPAFAAPEVIAGRAADGRLADVYSLGATLAFVLTGETMLPGRPDVFALERRGVPRGVQRAILAACAADPAERLRDMAAFEEALAKAGSGAGAGEGAGAGGGGRTEGSVGKGVAGFAGFSRGKSAGPDGDVAGAQGAAANDPPRSDPTMPSTTTAPTAAPADLGAYTQTSTRAKGAMASLICALLVWPLAIVFLVLNMSSTSLRVVEPSAPTRVTVRPSRPAPAAETTSTSAASSTGASSDEDAEFVHTKVSRDGGRTWERVRADGSSANEPSGMPWYAWPLIAVVIAVSLSPLVLEVLAFVLGLSALSRISASGGRLEGKALAIAGVVIATLNLCAPMGLGVILALRPAGPG